ncbi:MAG: hypothetical protein ACI90V_007615 [Bacillariaceae sp.]|jgi:hypothetical protein
MRVTLITTQWRFLLMMMMLKLTVSKKFKQLVLRFFAIRERRTKEPVHHGHKQRTTKFPNECIIKPITPT